MSGLRQHWREYLMEAGALSLFMISACFFAALLEHPDSPLNRAVSNAASRRGLMGIAMGLTAIALIYSPWGRRSGAHINPAVTLTFWRLKKISGPDAVFYIVAQFIGAVAGMAVATFILRNGIAHPAVHYVTTVPGEHGVAIAFLAEILIGFVQMTAILTISNRRSVAKYTGLLAGILVAVYITFESPLSGMSLNPARSFGSATVAETWTALWVYFIAPPLGMLLASQLYIARQGPSSVRCAKLHHDDLTPCIFKCGFSPNERVLLLQRISTQRRRDAEARSASADGKNASPAFSAPLGLRR